MISESHFIEDSQKKKRNWLHQQMVRGNEIVNKLHKNRSFLDFIVPLNYIIISDFALSRFSRPRSLQTEEKWEDP